MTNERIRLNNLREIIRNQPVCDGHQLLDIRIRRHQPEEGEFDCYRYQVFIVEPDGCKHLIADPPADVSNDYTMNIPELEVWVDKNLRQRRRISAVSTPHETITFHGGPKDGHTIRVQAKKNGEIRLPIVKTYKFKRRMAVYDLDIETRSYRFAELTPFPGGEWDNIE